MLNIISILESVISHVDSSNVTEFISLVEKLVTLAESIKNPPTTPNA